MIGNTQYEPAVEERHIHFSYSRDYVVSLYHLNGRFRSHTIFVQPPQSAVIDTFVPQPISRECQQVAARLCRNHIGEIHHACLHCR